MFPTNSKITNGKYLSLVGNARILSGIWKNDLGQYVNWTLQENIDIQGNFIQTNGLLNINGFTFDVKKDVIENSDISLNLGSMNVEGSFIHQDGILNLNKGMLKIKNNYRMQVKNADGTYTGSTGILKMLNKEDVMLVEGDFVFQSSYRHSTYLTYGLLEIKGNFTQKKNSYANNFNPSNEHITLLSGKSKQYIYLKPSYSKIQHIICHKTILRRVQLNNDNNIWNYYSNSDETKLHFGMSGTHAGDRKLFKIIYRH